MKSIAILASILLLAGCAAAPKLDDTSIQQIQASLPADAGAIKYSSVAIWLPNSKEFKFSAVEPTVKGVFVVTDRALLFQQWGGPTGLTTIKRIPLDAIQEEYLIDFGISSRVVVRSGAENYDSFAASDGSGEVSIGPETSEIHQTIHALLTQK